MGVKQDKFALQQFLKDRGGNLGTSGPRGDGVDGQPGRLTRQAILDVFKNTNAPAITSEKVNSIAAGLATSSAKVLAFADVESGKSGWFNTGRPKILWERHYFWRRIRIKILGISNPKPGGYTHDADRDGINDSWEKLIAAACRNPVAAFESASWGKFQIMGAHWKKLGYSSVFEFAYSMVNDEAGHYEAFARFIKTYGLAPKLRAISTNPEDNRAIAKAYNGRAYWKHNPGYHIRIANALRRRLRR